LFNPPLVGIEVANVTRIAVLEPENNTPVTRNIYRPVTPVVAFQWVEPPTGYIHILRFRRYVEVSQDTFYSGNVIWRNATSIAVLVKALQGPGLEVSYHVGV